MSIYFLTTLLLGAIFLKTSTPMSAHEVNLGVEDDVC